MDAVGFRHPQVFPGHVQRRQNIIVPDAFIRGIHPHGNRDVRSPTGIQPDQPARRTRAGPCAGTARWTRAFHRSRPAVPFRLFQTACRAQAAICLDDRGHDFRVTFPQPPVFLDETVINAGIVADQPVGVDQCSEAMAERRARWQSFRFVNEDSGDPTVQF
jgi:hypothetical protein